MKKQLGKIAGLSLLTLALMQSSSAFAESVKVGMSTALKGPAQSLGKNMKAGVEAYFDKVNAEGGVHGKKLKLLAYDDGYEPARAAPNMKKLIDEDKVIAVIGNVGTPTAIVAVPIANAKKTLLYGAFTGAGVLRQNPVDRYIINYRASYADETAAMIKGLMKTGIKPSELAFFTQNDGYGDAGYKGAMKALKAAGYSDGESLPHGRYTRNTSNVEDGLSKLLDADDAPKAVIIVGAYKPVAKFIKLAKDEFPDTLFLNVSFVGSAALKKELGDKADGVIVTQVVPHFNADIPAVKEYKAAMSKFKPGTTPGFVSFEGYLAAKTFVKGLKNGKDASREAVIDGLQGLGTFDIGTGEKMTYGKNQHQPTKRVWPTRIKNGKYESFDWIDLKK